MSVTLQPLEERTLGAIGMNVDREAGVIRNVKLIGLTSANGREYPAATLNAARAMYENKPINANHDRKGGERKIEDRFGRVISPRMTADGLYGDVQALKSHPMFERVCEAAEKMPHLFGMSHSAEGKVSVKNGKSIVEEIAKVNSVDLVTDGATTNGLFEGHDPEQITIELLLERLEQDAPDGLGTICLREIMSGVDVRPEDSLSIGGAGVDDQIRAAFRAMVMAAFDDPKKDAKGRLANIKIILDAQEKLMGVSTPTTTTTTPTVESKLDEATLAANKERDERLTKLEEQNAKLQAEIARRDAVSNSRALLETAGIEAKEALVNVLAGLPDEAGRKALIESLPKAASGAPAPRSAPPKTVPIDESKKLDVDINDDAKLAAFLR